MRNSSVVCTLFLVVALCVHAVLWRCTGVLWESVLPAVFGTVGLGLCAFVVQWRAPLAWRLHSGLVCLGALLMCAAPLVPTLWPCELTCSAGASYATLWGVPLQTMALMLYALCGFTALRHCGCAIYTHIHLLLAALGIGASLYFVCLSFSLQMLCPNCISIHGCMLALLCIHCQLRLIPLWRIAVMVAAGLGLCAAYALRSPVLMTAPVVPSVVSTDTGAATKTETSTETATSFAEVLHQRRHLNKQDATSTMHCFVRLNCRHCSVAMPAILSSITHLNEQHDCALVVHILVDPFSQADIDQAYLALASCLNGQQRLALLALMGHSAEQADSAALLTELRLPVSRYRSFIAAHTPDFNHALQASEQRYRRCVAASPSTSQHLPLFTLRHNDDDTLLQTWDGKAGWPQVIAELALYTHPATAITETEKKEERHHGEK